jgi:hypothetical protein
MHDYYSQGLLAVFISKIQHVAYYPSPPAMLL